MLSINKLSASREGKPILHEVTLDVQPGQVVALMGPNGSGKSTLAHVIMGDPRYTLTGGDLLLDGESIRTLPPHERAAKGLFLSFQYPCEIPGVTLFNFLRTALNEQRKARGERPMKLFDFTKLFQEKLTQLSMDASFRDRSLNDGFSGGEKKRAEMLQLLILTPRFAILDETDSGLDIDALRHVTAGVNAARKAGTGLLVITHYHRILDALHPDVVHILKNGSIVKTGGPELARTLEKTGYDQF